MEIYVMIYNLSHTVGKLSYKSHYCTHSNCYVCGVLSPSVLDRVRA